MEPSKVVAAIVPAQTEGQAARAEYESVWRELVETKAKLAEVMNEQRSLARAFSDLEDYCRRHVKRLDALTSRVARAAR